MGHSYSQNNIGQPNHRGATFIASVSLTSKLAFHIYKFDVEVGWKVSKTLDFGIFSAVVSQKSLFFLWNKNFWGHIKPFIDP